MSRTTMPNPRDPWESRRWQESRRRWRMLTGEWGPDLAARLERQLGPVRAEAVGDPDLSSNVLASVARQLSILHDEPPSITNSVSPSSAEIVAERMDEAGWAPTMQAFVGDLVALRDVPMRIDVGGDPANPMLRFRPIRPDMCVAWSKADAPDVAVGIREARMDREGRWLWEVLDVSDPANPSYRWETDDGTDVTVAVVGRAMSGAEYPYRDTNGVPFLPVWIYHAAKRPYLWDAYTGIEVVEGTLQAGVLMSFVVHAARSASWPQRYMMGAEPAGAGMADENRDGHGRREIVADPASVLILEPMQDLQGGAQIGQWETSADIEAMFAVVTAYEQRVAAFAGVSASDFQRTSGDPRSGYALSISQAGRRQAARKLLPTVREGDEHAVEISAKLLNMHARSGSVTLGLAEEGYAVTYTSLQLTPEEIAAKRESVLALLERGLIDRTEARAELRGETLDEAARKIAALDAARTVAT